VSGAAGVDPAVIGVFGASGNVGRAAVRLLADAGAPTRAIVRRRPVPSTAGAGVAVVEADVARSDDIVAATRGLDALLWLTPNDPAAADIDAYVRGVGATVARAVRENGIRRVVLVSAAGADLPGAGILSVQRHVETELAATDADLRVLRPAYFFENFLRQIDALAARRAVFEPYPEDAPIPMIAAGDVGAAAARLLLDADWTGRDVREVTGPRVHTMASAVTAFGSALGERFAYVRVPLAEAADAFRRAGASASVVEAYLAMMRVLCERGGPPFDPSTALITETTAEDFARDVLAPHLRATAARRREGSA
jgi:uncharacterized protein YbjT (DUF2867 family)